MKFGVVDLFVSIALVASTQVLLRIGQEFALLVSMLSMIIGFIYYKVLDAEIELKKEIKKLRKEIEGIKRNESGQFTIAGLFSVFIMLIVTMYLMPSILDICDQIALELERHNQQIASFLVRLIPASIVISILSAIFFYAKPIIMREE